MKKKILTAVLILALMFTCIAGTVAYLSDTSTVKNTFTIGDVKITLTEAVVDASGKATEKRTEEGNEYKLLPGSTYDKDPTVTVLADSESAYVRMLVTIGNLDKLKAAITAEAHPDYYNGDVFLLQYLVGGWDNTKWVYEGFDAAAGTYEFRYYQPVCTVDAEDEVLPALFTTITIPTFVDNDGLEKLSDVVVSIEADAIQTAGFADADAAWEAFN